MSSLSQRLGTLKVIQSLSSEQWNEAETLAYSLDEILESLRKLSPMHQSLADSTLSDEEATEILQEIFEELAHVAYHINDSKFLRLAAERHREAPR